MEYTIIKERDKNFIGTIWPQHCGDSLKILEKTNKQCCKGGNFLWKCEFQKYPYIVETTKQKIKNGVVSNPEVERIEFLEKEWFQNCGDSLRIIGKSNKKQGTNCFYICEFIKYPCRVEAVKKLIILGSVINPRVEEEEFIGKEFIQNCGDILIPIKRDKNVKRGNEYLWQCYFKGYENNILYAQKQRILRKSVWNPLNTNLYSNAEREVGEFLEKELKLKIEKNSWVLNKKEIDFYIPSLKIGFEFNGVYWHSQKFKDKNYHLDKLKLANSKGIKLYFVWEDEWNEEKNKIKFWIKNLIFNNQNIFNKELEKLGFIDKDKIYSEPILIERMGYFCWNCGILLI